MSFELHLDSPKHGEYQQTKRRARAIGRGIMKLPNADRAVIEDRKLLQYVLSPVHPHGRTHAHLFDRLLGINLANADVLRQALLQAAATEQAIPGPISAYGQKFEVRFSLAGPRGVYNVLSVWMVEFPNDPPRLVTAYIE